MTQLTRELATLLGAGQTVESALSLAREEVPDKGSAAALEGVLLQVRSGSSLSDALAAEPRYFPPLYVSLVRAGEQSGRLSQSLERARHHARAHRAAALQADLGPDLPRGPAPDRDRLGGRPADRGGAAHGADVRVRPVPRCRPARASSWRRPTSCATRATCCWRSWRPACCSASGCCGGPARAAPSTPGCCACRCSARCCATGSPPSSAAALATCLGGGLDLPAALAVCRDILGNLHARAAMEEVITRVRTGRTVADSLAAAGIMTPLAVKMLRVGEESGRMQPVAAHLADDLRGPRRDAAAAAGGDHRAGDGDRAGPRGRRNRDVDPDRRAQRQRAGALMNAGRGAPYGRRY